MSDQAPVKDAADCASMTDVRAAIDALDRQIVPLLAERALYVARAAALKPVKTQVVDPARIEDVVAKATKTAEAHGMDRTLIDAIYRAMVAAYIAFETERWDSEHKS